MSAGKQLREKSFLWILSSSVPYFRTPLPRPPLNPFQRQ